MYTYLQYIYKFVHIFGMLSLCLCVCLAAAPVTTFSIEKGFAWQPMLNFMSVCMRVCYTVI